MLLSIVIFATLLFSGSYQQHFKKCHDSGFCVRHSKFRQLKIESPYQIQNIKTTPDQGIFNAEIWDSFYNVSLNLAISTLKDSIRFKIFEKAPFLITQNRVVLAANYSINNLPDSVPFTSAQQSNQEIDLFFGTNNQLHIQFKPIAINLSINGVPVLNFNEKNLFYYEHYRTRPSRFIHPELEYGAWEENWSGHVDSKPNGPTSVGFDVTFPGAEHVYGLAEHGSSYNLKSTHGKDRYYHEPYRLYNVDHLFPTDSSEALYGSIPFMVAHKKDATIGLLWVNSAEMWVDVEREVKNGKKSTSTHWRAESGILDLFVFLGPTPKHVSSQFTSLTGTTPLPQFFSLGYHQCRYSYLDQHDVLDVVDKGFDQHDIPYDVLWLDIGHTDGMKYFTWDYKTFYDPVQMQNKLAEQGRKMVTIIDPHIKKDDGYHVYREGKEKNLFVKNKHGNDYEGKCWPGISQWVDYTNPLARDYWASLYGNDKYKDSTSNLYTWNDMNEPAVFEGPEWTMPKDNLHFNNIEHREVHNLYGMLQQKSTFQGQLERSNYTDRPFVLSRSFFIGTQRYGAIWTGDNYANWEHLRVSVPMLLNIGVCGITFAGADIGGFAGVPDGQLVARWYQVASFQPFFRGHSAIDTPRREPWLFGEPYTTVIRNSIKNRYKLLPYLYSLFYESEKTGVPVMRPMMYEFPEDEKVFGMDDQFMVGGAILVKPVTHPNVRSISVYLGKKVWYDYATLKEKKADSHGNIQVDTPLDFIPVYLKGGNVVPKREKVMKSSALVYNEPITLVVALDENGSAKGSLYLDDGKSFNYQKGDYTLAEYTFEKVENKVTFNSKVLNNCTTCKVSYEKIVIGGVSGKIVKIDKDVPWKQDDNKLEITWNGLVSEGFEISFFMEKL